MTCCPTCRRPMARVLVERSLDGFEDPYEVTWRGEPIPMTTRQTAILVAMIRRGGDIAFEQVESIGVGESADDLPAVAKAQIYHVRQAIRAAGCDFHIKTIRGWGYRIADGPARTGKRSCS